MLLKCINKPTPTDQLIIDKFYIVMGLSVINNKIRVLVLDPTYYPTWYSMEYFTQEDKLIPEHFIIRTHFPYDEWYKQPSDLFGLTINEQTSLIMGYPLLVDSSTHYFNLIERNKNDINIFREEYKKVADHHYSAYLEILPNDKDGLEFQERRLMYPE